ncbi:MAG: trimeric intracellular cation channel family protein [Hyphomonadaceae bacterium]|nr:trimeric intracellular cation channel family protein [Hyphomonadaceae bacterium]MBC6413194.1 trimeric intracellular cation channel family protein [Hyphomonadaceae bacterium]
MLLTSIYDLFVLIGTYAFAVSGGIAAVRKDMDILGIVLVSFLPAVGGGTLRDICLDRPVFWLSDSLMLWVALAGGLSAFFFYCFFSRLQILRWMDAIGLAAFAPLGASMAMYEGYGAFVAVLMGVLTAIAGGLIRDVVCQDEMLIMKGDIYATAAILGAVSLWLFKEILGLDSQSALPLAFLVTLATRAAGIIFHLGLPHARVR